MKFRLIPLGEFMMGSTPKKIEATLKVALEKLWQDEIRSEGPLHKVILTMPVYFGMCEVTQQQYKHVIGNNPSYFSMMGEGKNVVAGMDTSNNPVENVSWHDAIDFSTKLSEHEKLEPFRFQLG